MKRYTHVRGGPRCPVYQDEEINVVIGGHYCHACGANCNYRITGRGVIIVKCSRVAHDPAPFLAAGCELLTR